MFMQNSVRKTVFARGNKMDNLFLVWYAKQKWPTCIVPRNIHTDRLWDELPLLRVPVAVLVVVLAVVVVPPVPDLPPLRCGGVAEQETSQLLSHLPDLLPSCNVL